MKAATPVVLAAHRARRVRRPDLVVGSDLPRRLRHPRRRAGRGPQHAAGAAVHDPRPLLDLVPGGVRTDQDLHRRRGPLRPGDGQHRHQVGRHRRGSGVHGRVPDPEPHARTSCRRPPRPAPAAIASHYTELPRELPGRPDHARQQHHRQRHDRRTRRRCCSRTGSGRTSRTTSTCSGATASTPSRPSSTQRKGYCEQFAGTFAAFARSLGLPARVAVGFTQGTLGPDGLYHVEGKHAHAWPEVYFSGIGWVPFEPTPTRGAPGDEIFTGVPTAAGGRAAAVDVHHGGAGDHRHDGGHGQPADPERRPRRRQRADPRLRRPASGLRPAPAAAGHGW